MSEGFTAPGPGRAVASRASSEAAASGALHRGKFAPPSIQQYRPGEGVASSSETASGVTIPAATFQASGPAAASSSCASRSRKGRQMWANWTGLLFPPLVLLGGHAHIQPKPPTSPSAVLGQCTRYPFWPWHCCWDWGSCRTVVSGSDASDTAARPVASHLLSLIFLPNPRAPDVSAEIDAAAVCGPGPGTAGGPAVAGVGITDGLLLGICCKAPGRP